MAIKDVGIILIIGINFVNPACITAISNSLLMNHVNEDVGNPGLKDKSVVQKYALPHCKADIPGLFHVCFNLNGIASSGTTFVCDIDIEDEKDY